MLTTSLAGVVMSIVKWMGELQYCEGEIFANGGKWEEKFPGSLGATNYDWVWPLIFTAKNFTYIRKTMKFAKVLSFESFPLYDSFHAHRW